jgi:hypothetical protein
MATIRPSRRIPAVAVAIVAALAFTACGSDDSADPPTDSVTMPADTSPAATAPDTTAAPTTVAPTTTAPATTAPATTVPGLIEVTVGVDSGEDRIERVALGSEVTIRIVNPGADDEFHLHDYDLGDGKLVPAGQLASFTFIVDRAGSFELESHETGEVYLILEVA